MPLWVALHNDERLALLAYEFGHQVNRLAARVAGAFLAALPAHESERWRRLGALRCNAVDSMHPPTHMRVQLLATGVEDSLLVEKTTEEWAAADAELQPRSSKVEERVRDHWGAWRQRPSFANLD